MSHFIFQLQVDSTATQVSMKTISVLELISDTGTLLIVVPLLIFSLVGIYIFFERFMVLNNASKLPANFMLQIKDFIYDGKLDAAKALCSSMASPFARMVEKGVLRIGKPISDIKIEMEHVGQVELNKLEKGIHLLAIIAGSAPMLGFLGTVTGMVVTFNDIKNAGQAVKVNELSGGIMQALVTTVAGLIVGIIAYLAYNTLTSKTQQVAHKMEEVTLEFMDVLQEPAK